MKSKYIRNEIEIKINNEKKTHTVTLAIFF